MGHVCPHDEGALSAKLQIVSKPLGNETSQLVINRLTCAVTDFRRDPGRAMAEAILITMSRNIQAKIEYSSLVMRQVSARSRR